MEGGWEGKRRLAAIGRRLPANPWKFKLVWPVAGSQRPEAVLRILVQQTSTRTDQPGCAPSPAAIDAALHARAGGNLRWVICALLFFATTINYMDRQVLGILAPFLQKTIGWNEIQY